jgi:hypothetical protein
LSQTKYSIISIHIDHTINPQIIPKKKKKNVLKTRGSLPWRFSHASQFNVTTGVCVIQEAFAAPPNLFIKLSPRLGHFSVLQIRVLSDVSAPLFEYLETRDKENDCVPEALERKYSGRGDMVLEG